MYLNDGLQLTSISQRILYDKLAIVLALMLALALISCVGEVYVPIAHAPASVFGKLNNIAFGFEEEKTLGRADWQAGIRTLATAGDFGADLVLQDLSERQVSDGGMINLSGWFPTQENLRAEI